MTIGGPFRDKARRGAKKKWYLSYFVPKTDADGAIILKDGKSVMERKRPYYETQEDAQSDKPRIVAQYAAAGNSAEGGGVLSREEASEYQEAKLIAPEVPLAELARFWRKHNPLQATLRVSDHVTRVLEVLKVRRGERDEQYLDLKSRLKIFVGTFGARIPDTITRKEIVDWLFTYPGKAKSARTVINLKQNVCAFFNILRADGVVTQNPAGGIKRKELPKWVPKEIGFLSLDYSTAYLRALERYDTELLAHELIQLLAGVRADDEMANFNGSWVLPATREIVIPAEIAKTGRREVIAEMEPVFWDWWTIYGRGGILRPKSFHARWTRIRMLAAVIESGGEGHADELAKVSLHKVAQLPEAKAAVKAWPWNARRRTFATFHVAAKQSADQTALIMRHRGDTYTLHNSYRGTGVTQAQGIAYFARAPQPVLVSISPATAKMPPRGIVRRRMEAKSRLGS